MLKNFLKIFLLMIILTSGFDTLNVKADNHTPNMSFDFLPKFVHYQGEIKVNGKSLSEIETAIDFIEVKIVNQKQIVTVDGKQIEVEEGQFEFKTFYGDPISGKYHVDIGPGVPEETKFDIYVAGVKANEFLLFNPTPRGGCPVSNCFNRELNITIDTIPTPTPVPPTPVPPTPTPLPTVNPSFYSGQIIIGSSPVPDGIDVFAKIGDYISEVVITSEGRYTLNVNPKTVNYVGQNIYLIIQGNQSITSIPFNPDEFISDANYLFENFELKIEEDPVPTPEPEKIIVIATPTPDIQKTEMITNESLVENDSGGCGGGSSSISIFSVLVSILAVLLYKRSRRHHNSVI